MTAVPGLAAACDDNPATGYNASARADRARAGLLSTLVDLLPPPHLAWRAIYFRCFPVLAHAKDNAILGDAIVRHCLIISQLLASEKKLLLIRWQVGVILNLLLQILHRVRFVHDHRES